MSIRTFGQHQKMSGKSWGIVLREASGTKLLGRNFLVGLKQDECFYSFVVCNCVALEGSYGQHNTNNTNTFAYIIQNFSYYIFIYLWRGKEVHVSQTHQDVEASTFAHGASFWS